VSQIKGKYVISVGGGMDALKTPEFPVLQSFSLGAK
jgi:hypothetical protein